MLITGASGQLGAYLVREATRVGLTLTAWSGSRTGESSGVLLQPVDLANADAVIPAFHEARPELVIHAAARASMADCLRDPESARRVNTLGTATLANLAAETATRLIFVSTDLVFDGEHAPYHESHEPSPLSIYARTKVDAEQFVAPVPNTVVVRVSLLYGLSQSGRPTFFDEQVASFREGRRINLFHDEWRTPLDLATAARAIVAIAQSDVTGKIHVGGPQRMSRLEMGRRLATFLGVEPWIEAVSRESSRHVEPRPRDTSLDSSRWRALFPNQPWPDFDTALKAMCVFMQLNERVKGEAHP